jgi:hypothetical protein
LTMLSCKMADPVLELEQITTEIKDLSARLAALDRRRDELRRQLRGALRANQGKLLAVSGAVVDTAAAVQELVAHAPNQGGVTKDEVAAKLGIQPHAAATRLVRAVGAKLIRRSGRGLYSPIEATEGSMTSEN